MKRKNDIHRRFRCITTGLIVCCITSISGIGISIFLFVKMEKEGYRMQCSQLQLEKNPMEKVDVLVETTKNEVANLEENLVPINEENIFVLIKKDEEDAENSNLFLEEDQEMTSIPNTDDVQELCDGDDSDLCSSKEGSGDNSEYVSSSDVFRDCYQFPRPTCPEYFEICTVIKNNCPVPVCCPSFIES